MFTALSDYAPYFYDNGPHSNGNLAFFSLSEDTPKGMRATLLLYDIPNCVVHYVDLYWIKEHHRLNKHSHNLT